MMRKSLITAAIAASLISTAAFAAHSRHDAIKSLDQAKHQLTLADGKVFELPARAGRAAGFKAGDKVTVTYRPRTGR